MLGGSRLRSLYGAEEQPAAALGLSILLIKDLATHNLTTVLGTMSTRVHDVCHTKSRCMLQNAPDKVTAEWAVEKMRVKEYVVVLLLHNSTQTLSSNAAVFQRRSLHLQIP